MQFIWAKQIRNQQLLRQQQSIIIEHKEEDIQTVNLPMYDKISDIEHKNGKRLVNTRQKDNENNEIQRDLQKR